MTPLMVSLEALAWKAFRAYRPRPHRGPVSFFKASVRPPDFCDPVPTWQAATGGLLTVVPVPGDHFTMIREPCVPALAGLLIEQLLAPSSRAVLDGSVGP
jgi:thioesterase domain-containing protein